MLYSLSKLKYWTTVLFLFMISVTNLSAQTIEEPVKISNATEWNNYAQRMLTQAAYRKYKYILTDDIDFTGVKMVPMGGLTKSAGQYSFSSGSAFSGEFDGNGHKLMNISAFDFPSTRTNLAVAPFGAVSGTVKNVIVDGLTVPKSGNAFINSQYAAGLCAYQLNSTSVIENCAVINSSLFAGKAPLGGIVGNLYGGKVANCAVSGVTFYNPDGSGQQIGGVVGTVGATATIENCYSNVVFDNAQSKVGGIVGNVSSTATTKSIMENCYSGGLIKLSSGATKENIGGLIGSANNISVKNCGSSDSIYIYLIDSYVPQSTAGAFGFIASNNVAFDNIYATANFEMSAERGTNAMSGINSFYGNKANGVSVTIPATCYNSKEFYQYLVDGDYVRSLDDKVYGAPATLLEQNVVRSGCLAIQMNDDQALGATNFIWAHRKGCFNNYPVPFGRSATLLELLVKIGVISDDDKTALSTVKPVCGDVETTIHIKTANDMANAAKMLNDNDAAWSTDKTFVVDNDITDPVSSVIGTADKPFLGVFDGGSHLINMAVTGSASNVGVIGVAAGSAKIKNVRVMGSVSGADNVGGVVGKASAGVSISGCASAAAVSGKSYVGGVVGSAAGSVTSAVNVATIKGSSNVGGIAGSAASLTDCANMGYINCADASTSGGIAGTVTGAVSNCLSAGFVKGAAIANGATVSACFYDEKVAVGGQTGATAFQMTETKTLALTGWSGAPGSYPVPSAFASSAIGALAANAVYFVNTDNATQVSDSIVADGSVWTCSNTSVLNLHNMAFLPIAEGNAILSVSTDGMIRELPVTTANPGLYSGGFGNFYSPFIIKKHADLYKMFTYVASTDGAEGKHFELANDITDGVVDFSIGSTSHHFKGYFYSSKGKMFNVPVNIVNSFPTPTGLFGVVDGLVERVSVSGSVSNTASGITAYAGGIAGFSEGRIVNCLNAADVSGKGGATIGGICGATTGHILSCTNVGRVTGTGYSAGISTSDVSTLLVSDCFNGGEVSGATAAGIAAMVKGGADITPSFSNNVNVAVVNGASRSDALVFVNGANASVVGGVYDTQHTLATSANASAVADSTRKLTNEVIAGWTSSAGSLYPKNSVASPVAAAPVFLNVLDSANNVKHDFYVATDGVTWTSAQGLLEINAGKVSRIGAGADTLIATAGSISRRVPVAVGCAWKVVEEPEVEVCNMYAGVKYTTDTDLNIKDTTDNADPNADCGTIHVRKIHVRVGAAGQDLAFTGCGSYVYDGVTYKRDTLFTNKTCDYVKITVYPEAKAVDSVATLSCTETSYVYKASNGNLFEVKRSSKPVADSVVVIDHIKSKVCDCDSIVRKVIVNIPSFETETTIDGTLCNEYEYTKLDGSKVSLGFPLSSRDPMELYFRPKVQSVVYRDTLFTTDGCFSEIKTVTANIYKSVYKTDTVEHVGKECSVITLALSDGDKTFEGERYLKDSTFYDKYFDDIETCPSTVIKYKIRLKGISVVKDTIYIGKHDAPRCTTCPDVIVLNELSGDEYANVGFCDKVTYKRYATDARPVVKKADAKDYLNFDADETSCGTMIPFKISVNKSDVVDSVIYACSSYDYKTKTGRTFTMKRDTAFTDTLSGVVPGCGCDSVWKVKAFIYNPTLTTNDVTACGEYTFDYLDKSRNSLRVLKDTVIVDTAKNFMGCDSIVRTSTIVVHPVYAPSQNEEVRVVACNEYVYVSAVKGEIVCKADTLFNDSLTTAFGCDSIVPVRVTISKPIVVDSVVYTCDDYTYRYKKGGTIFIPLGDNPAIIDTTSISDVLPNVDPTLCDTVLNITVYSHGTIVRKPAPVAVCGERNYTRFDGSTFPIVESVTIYDTLKSRVCDCDSIIRIDSFSVGEPVYPTDETPLDTTLYGCRLNTTLVYHRKANAWNSDTTISFAPVSSEMPNQVGFLDIVRHSNPSVVKLDTVRERLDNGRTVLHYYWLAHDTMKTVAGCDSVVPFRVEYDGQHILGRRYFYVDHKYAPFEYNGVTYQMPDFVRGVATYDSVEVVLPSTTGGCDTSYFAMIKMYPCKISKTDMKACDKASFYNLHHEKVEFIADTVYSDTLRYTIADSDTARCDSVIQVWDVKVGASTPSNLIEPLYLGGCDSVIFHRTAVATNVMAEDSVIRHSTSFRCRYLNSDGCDSVVTVNADVHVTEVYSMVIRKTDFYRYVSPVDHSILRITSDTVIEERIPDGVEVTLPNGETYTCDSLVVSNIIIRSAEWRDTTITGCDSVFAIASADSIRGEFSDMTKKWYKANTDFDVPNSVTINPYYHVHIRVNNSVTKDVNIDSCLQATYKNVVYTRDTTFVETFSTVLGCDSIVNVKIHILPVEHKEKTLAGCGFYNYNGEVFTNSYTVYDTIRYKGGCNCDSIITAIHIDITEPTVVERTIDSCMFFTYPKLKLVEYNPYVGAKVYKATGEDSVYLKSQSFYQYLSADENGCDTLAHINMNVNSCYPYPVIINKYNWILALNKDLLFKDVHADRITGYQWYKNGEMLLGANQSYYTEDKPLAGCYKVSVMYGDVEVESENICIDSSKSVVLDYKLYPDPVAIGEKVSIKCNFDLVEAGCEIYNTLGVRIFKSELNADKDSSVEIPYRFSNSGNYYLKLTTAEGTVLGKKFIVR